MMYALVGTLASVVDSLTAQIALGGAGIYTGGKGVLIRALFDGLPADTEVAPASFIVNDLAMPSIVYPGSGGGAGNPQCPVGPNPLYPSPTCATDPATGDSGPWNYAQLAVVVGSSMPNLMWNYSGIQSVEWNFGVFYATDANSVDQRCRNIESSQTYDCAGGWLDYDGTWKPDAAMALV